MKKSFYLVLPKKTILIFCLIAFVAFSQAVGAQFKTQAVTEKGQMPLSSVSEEVQKLLEKDWGIRIVGLRATMSGLMVDFRYKIIDAKKASSLLDINKKVYLLVEKNQARLGVPNAKKVGALRQTTHTKKVKKGRDYFILFGNPGARYITPGDKATLVIGDLKVEHLTLL